MVNPDSIFRGRLDIFITDESGIKYKCSGRLINFTTNIKMNITHYAEFELSKVEYDDETSTEVTLVPPVERLLRKIDS